MTTNIAASIRQRLLSLAKQRKEDFNYVLTQYAIQRLLYRLSISEFKDQFLLKGALLFSVWNQELHRPTRDADLLGFGSSDVESLVTTFKHICAIKPDSKQANDGLDFNIDSIQGQDIKKEAKYQGVRINGYAELAKARIAFQVDIGFGDIVTPKPEHIELPSYLNLPCAQLNVYPIYTVVSEKFQAMVELGLANSRMKDFYDIAFLSNTFDFNHDILTEAIQKTFENRKTPITKNPIVFAEDFAKDANKQIQWQAFIRKNKLDNISSDFEYVIKKIESFLRPIINALI